MILLLLQVYSFILSYNSLDEVSGSVDVDTCCNIAGNITPMPGGTDMLPTVMLMQNTMKTMVLQENLLPLYEKMGGKLSYYQSLLNSY